MIRSITDVYVASEKHSVSASSRSPIRNRANRRSEWGLLSAGLRLIGGIDAALRSARAAAGNKDIRLGGGVATIREYLKEGLVDEMHLAISPVLLGAGEHLLSGLDLPKLGYRVTEHVPSAAATHIVLTKQP